MRIRRLIAGCLLLVPQLLFWGSPASWAHLATVIGSTIAGATALAFLAEAFHRRHLGVGLLIFTAASFVLFTLGLIYTYYWAPDTDIGGVGAFLFADLLLFVAAVVVIFTPDAAEENFQGSPEGLAGEGRDSAKDDATD